MDFIAPSEVDSKESLRFAYVREQGYDGSCGYSSLASLLAIYWNCPVAEEDLVGQYAGDASPSGGFGVSLASLSRILSDFGFSAKGFRMNWEQLGAALARYAPVIVHYSRPDRHFALALEADAEWIILLDPALGCELLSRRQFLERWSGVVLLAHSATARRDEAALAEALRAGRNRRDLLEGRAR